MNYTLHLQKFSQVETTTATQIATTLVNLLKWDPRLNEFKQYRTILVPSEKLQKTVDDFKSHRATVKEFYKYAWSTDGAMGDLYCVSPSVFDEIEISQV